MLTLHSLSTYDRSAIHERLDALIVDYPSLDRQLRTLRRLLLKPNFVVPARDASNTHPTFYMAIATWLRERYPMLELGIGESPAIGSCRGGLKAHGVLDECASLGIEIVEFRRARPFTDPNGDGAYRTLSIASELDAWDGVINLPKIKTHQQFRFTAATKNLYGCVVGPRKFVRHNQCGNDPVRFARMLLANAREISTILHIGDGIEAMHVKGPRGGEPYPLGAMPISTDALALDGLVCRLIDLDAASTPLFQALEPTERHQIDTLVESVLRSSDFERALTPFVHALPSAISFSPWHVARSGWRRLRHRWHTTHAT